MARISAEEGPRQARAEERGPEPGGVGQHGRDHVPHHALRPRPPVGVVDTGAGIVDQVHVVDARRAGGHAGEARQAAVDVERHLLVGRLVVLQHVLDQVDAAARAVELVAEQDVGRAGRGAEAAMDAAAEDLLGNGGVGIGKLGEGEIGLHRRYTPASLTFAAAPCAARRVTNVDDNQIVIVDSVEHAIGKRRNPQRKDSFSIRPVSFEGVLSEFLRSFGLSARRPRGPPADYAHRDTQRSPPARRKPPWCSVFS